MRFRTRAFLICFVPFALLLTGGFWMIQRSCSPTVRDGLRTSLRENQLAIAGIHSKSDLQNSRFLQGGRRERQPSRTACSCCRQPHNHTARRTVEDQLRELGQHMGFDFLLVSGPNGAPLAAVARQTQQRPQPARACSRRAAARARSRGLLSIDGRTFQVASVPIDQNEENIGALSVGAYFDLAEFTTPAVLPTAAGHRLQYPRRSADRHRRLPCAAALRGLSAAFVCMAPPGFRCLCRASGSGYLTAQPGRRRRRHRSCAGKSYTALLRGCNRLRARRAALQPHLVALHRAAHRRHGLATRKTSRHRRTPQFEASNPRSSKFASWSRTTTAPPSPCARLSDTCRTPTSSSSAPWPMRSMPAIATPPATAARQRALLRHRDGHASAPH